FGWASYNWLFYVTGGLAISHVDVSQTIAFSGSPFFVTPGGALGGASAQSGRLSDNTLGGWTIGGGIGYAFGNRWSIKGEYLFVDFRDQHVQQVNSAFPAFTGTATANLSASIARAGINYRF